MYTIICKTDSQREFAVCLREPKLGLCDNLEGWAGEGGGKEVQDGGDICIPMADSCGCLTKTQYCKAIILQLKINKLKRKELRNLKAGSLSRLRFSPGRGEYGCTATANLLVAKKKKKPAGGYGLK